MDGKVKKKWVEALRSGKYQQGKDSLRPGVGSFCCLGVLCDILRPNGWDSEIAPSDGYPPAFVRSESKLNLRSAKRLARLNDDGKSFEEIAANIEETI